MKISSTIAENFERFLYSLENTSLNKNINKDITLQIFYDLFRIREAQWMYKINFKRGIDHSLSEVFQDLIAHYLKMVLSKEYEIILEYKQKKLRPDILIKKNKKNWSIIEIKTTIGWDRGLIKDNLFMNRLKELSVEFKVPLKRIFYIFESSRNINKEFTNKFRNARKEKIHQYIFPLFDQGPSPYYIIKKMRKCKDKEIIDLYNSNKITDFNTIINKIK